MTIKTTPFWVDDFPRPVDLPASPLPERVAVVGGGYTGLSAARTLAQNGSSVAVLEQGQIGYGASAMNGGQYGPGVKLDIESVFKKYGPELGHEIWDATISATKWLVDMLDEEAIDCDLIPNGYIGAATKPSHYRAMADEIEWMAKHLNCTDFELVPPEKMRIEIGSDAFFGGMIEYIGGGVHPAKYLFGLAGAASKAGALLCEDVKVESLNREVSQFRLTTSRGQLTADAVLLTTNGYTGPLVKQIQRRVFTIGSYMIVTEPLPPELQRELCPNNRMMFNTKNFLNYFRLTPDGRMSMGGRNNLSPNLDVMESAKILTETMLEFFPQLRGVPVTHTWSGQLGITFDMMPHIGQVDGVYYAFGYGGHGVALAGYLGKEAAELMVGKINRSPFADIPHETSVLYHGNPWFLPLVATYYRFLDAIS